MKCRNSKDDNNKDNEELYDLFVKNKIFKKENKCLKLGVRDLKEEIKICVQ